MHCSRKADTNADAIALKADITALDTVDGTAQTGYTIDTFLRHALFPQDCY